jgi:hypothetical protein
MTKPQLEDLKKRVLAATGEDRELDRLIGETLDPDGASTCRYSSSVDDCIALIGAILPDWSWHVGHGPLGVMPYASLHRKTTADDRSDMRVEATASTVPLALLRAMVKALSPDR